MTYKMKKKSGSEEEEPVVSEHEELREIKASKIVNRHVRWSIGAGLVPAPGVDTGLVALVQLKMLRALSKNYEVNFSKNIGKSSIATLVGYATANSLRGSVATSLIKAVPGVGIVGSFTMPIYSGALTYAVGKIFIQHFEAGGTFLNFKPYKVKEYFAKLYKDGQNVAKDLKDEKEDSAET